MAKEIQFRVRLSVDGKEQLVTATSSVAEMRKAMEAAKGSAARFRDVLIGYNQGVQVMQNLSSAIGQITGTLNSVTEESRSFGAAMKAANTMAGKDEAGFVRLKDQVAELSKAVPMARDQLANGLYQVISNGVPEDNWISYLEKSARSAVGGIADVGEVVKVTSTVIKNYGLGWDAAGAIQDKIQLTAKNGVTSFEQLAQALPRVTSNAATLGVSIEELLATFATLTGVSGNTAEVSTQLAAVFTALVKPSSEAAKMAQEMGIQFDAAAIKAAGGMGSFLAGLDKQIKQYAQASGRLEQEIYGKLFGSAESLRALIPLTGELSDKFSENVAAMADSTGTMDAAFEEMASTGTSRLQMLKNEWGKYTDWIADKVGGIQPLLNFGSQLGTTTVSVLTLVEAFKKLHVLQSLMSAKVVRNVAAYALFGTNARKVAQATHVMSQSFRSAQTRAVALKIAIRGLVAATGIGLALTALCVVLEKLVGSLGKTADGMKSASREMRNAEEAAKRLEDLESSTADAYTNASAALEINKEKLKNLIAAKNEGKDITSEEKKIVGQLNDTYGDTMGCFDSVAKWYDALIQNSEAYCRQMVIEAKTRTLADQIARKEAETRNLIYDDKGNKREYSTKREIGQRQIKRSGGNAMNALQNSGINGIEYFEIEGTSEAEKVAQQIKDNQAVIENLKQQMRDAVKEKGEIDFKVKGSKIRPDTGGVATTAPAAASGQDKKEAVETPAVEGSIDWYQKRMDELRKQIEATGDEAAAKALQADYQALEKELKEYKVRIGVEQPPKEEVQSAVEKMQDELAAAQSELDNAVTVEAKVAAAAKVAEIQAQIDEATKGRVTIGAEVGTSYIAPGSDEDKRQSYANAQQKASRIRQDYEIGLIGKDKALEEIAKINAELEKLGLKPVDIEIKSDDASLAKKKVQETSDAFSAMGQAMGNIGNIVGENAGQWLQWGANLMQAVGQAIPAIASLVVSKKAEANANTEAAATGAASSVAGIPFVGPIMAVAAVASVLAALANLPKFAKGGIAYGPTLGLFGEYAGATNNPEVIAPLDRLRSMLQPVGGLGGEVKFKIKGRYLVGVVGKENEIANRS